jgi:hypothetical protein
MFTQLISLFANAPSSCEKKFFDLWPWFHYLSSNDFGPNKANHSLGKCDINNNFNIIGGSSDLPLILLAIIDDLLRIAGMIAVGFVIYGAFKYVASQGSPENVANAQGTIINALIGLAISIAAVAFVGFLGKQLGG